MGGVGGAASGHQTSRLALNPTPPTRVHSHPCIEDPMSPPCPPCSHSSGPWWGGGTWDRRRDSPLPNPRFPHMECLHKEGRDWAFGKRGASGTVREGFLEEVVPERAPGALTTCSALCPSYPGCLRSAPACPHARRPSQSALDASLGGGGEERELSGTPGCPANCPEALLQSQPRTADPAATRVPGSGQEPGLWCLSPVGVAVTQAKDTHTHTSAHTHVHVHTHPTG